MHHFRICSVLTLLLALATIPLCLDAQKREFPQPKLPADPKIAAALKEISPQQIQGTIEKLVSFGTRLTLSAQDPGSIAAGHGIGAAREWIKSEFERYSRDCGGCLEVRTDTFTQAPADRILSKMKFPATIIFLTVAGEEQGLNGSHHFAWIADQKRDEWQIEAVLNNDIVGGDKNPQQDPRTVRVFSEGIPSDTLNPMRGPASLETEAVFVGKNLRQMRALGGENDSSSRQLARYIAEAARAYSPDVSPLLIFRPDRYLRGGDQTSFNQYGFAAVRFTEFREDYHHQHQNVRTENGIEYGDLTKFVNFDYVASVARLNAATLASAPAPPQDVHLLTKELENDSTLTWDKSPRASGYEVLWRSTSSPDWEHAKDVGNVTRATLSISKDNVIFALGAVDGEGHRSLPVTP